MPCEEVRGARARRIGPRDSEVPCVGPALVTPVHTRGV